MMPIFPPIPAWSQAHPILVHFPIALLLVAPLAVVGALVLVRHRRVLTGVAAVMVGLGAAFAVLATASGDAAEDGAGIPAGARAVLDRHEDLAELARNLFLGLAGVLAAGAVVMGAMGPRVSVAVGTAGLLVYLVLHLGASVVLANAAHEGGRLVHELGGAGVQAGGARPREEED